MLYGIIDVGSNSIRLCVYEAPLSGKSIVCVHDRKVMAGLARYVDSSGVLSEVGISKAQQAISELHEAAVEFGAVETRVFATAVIRNAANAKAVAAAIERACAVDIDVLTGKQEAYLGFVGAQRSVDAEEGIFFDIGGGSTEVTHFRGGRPVHSESLPLGSLNMRVAHVKGMIPTAEEIDAIEGEVFDTLEAIPQFQDTAYSEIYGVGGSVRAAAKLLQSALVDGSGTDVTAREIEGSLDMVVRYPKDVLARVSSILPDRVETLFPGMAIQEALLRWFGADRVIMATSGVREGYLRYVVLGQD